MRTPIAVTIALVAALVIALPAAAESPSTAEAEARFERGRELSRAGRHEAACEEYAASQALDPALGTLLYLADCYERTGKLASAWSAFREAASLATASGHEQRRATAEARLDALEPRLARVEISVPPSSALDGLEVRLSGRLVARASWGVALPVDPGDHRIDARAPGREPWLANVRVDDEASHERVEIPLLPAPVARRGTTFVERPSEPPPAPVSSPRRNAIHPQRIAAIAVGAVGVGSVAAGAILGARALARNEDSVDECEADDPSRCSPLGVELRDEAQDNALASTIAFISGGGLIAAGVALYFTAGIGDDAPPRMGRLAPLVTQQGPGLLWEGAW